MLSPRMLRWSVFLNGYQHTLLHRPGKQMSHADGLSRLPLMHQRQDDPAPAEVVMLLDELPESPVHADDVAQYSAKDGGLSRVLSWVWRGWPRCAPSSQFTSFVSRQHELSAHKGCLLWGNRVVIPQRLRVRVLEALHAGHPGIVRMKALARSYVRWPGMHAAIEEWVRRCLPCQETRPEMPRAPVNAVDVADVLHVPHGADVFDMWHLSGEPTVPPFLCTVEMFGKPFPMELDTGASVSVMPMDKFQRAFPETWGPHSPQPRTVTTTCKHGASRPARLSSKQQSPWSLQTLPRSQNSH
ncbi:hypothetical protein MTO96_024319 [Rhipicephalus appendiculatus]